jgi:erythromycin esterase-like protein
MKRQSAIRPVPDEKYVSRLINEHAWLPEDEDDLQPLFERIGDARIVMLGEASHGTHEYYTWRARISKKLITEKGFNFIAVEGDWPDCFRLNRWIKGYETNGDAYSILHAFNRWPTWMWANWEMVALSEWLHLHNAGLSADKRTGFYGLDVYSLWESMESIINYLQKNDPGALQAAKEAYSCFEPYRKGEGASYARSLRFVPEGCREEVLSMLKKIKMQMPTYDGEPESAFSAEQNAMVSVNAEKYYRSMLEGGGQSWNIRDKHMMDTLQKLLRMHGENSKAIVWEHNTHIGDASATDMAREGMFNIGQLARQEYDAADIVLTGFGSYKGTVMAGDSWGAPMQVMQLPEARKGSWEYLLRMAGSRDKLIIMDDLAKDELMNENYFGHRAVGVVYNPEMERYGNYVPTILPQRYDAFIYLEETSALHAIHMQPHGNKMPDTFPFGV